MDYVALQRAAEGMLKEFGSITMFRRTESGGPDPITGEVPPEVVTDIEVIVVILPLDSATGRAIDALGVARSSARKVLMSGLTALVPRAGDKLWVEGAWRMLPLMTPLAPNMATTTLYKGAVSL